MLATLSDGRQLPSALWDCLWCCGVDAECTAPSCLVIHHPRSHVAYLLDACFPMDVKLILLSTAGGARQPADTAAGDRLHGTQRGACPGAWQPHARGAGRAGVPQHRQAAWGRVVAQLFLVTPVSPLLRTQPSAACRLMHMVVRVCISVSRTLPVCY